MHLRMEGCTCRRRRSTSRASPNGDCCCRASASGCPQAIGRVGHTLGGTRSHQARRHPERPRYECRRRIPTWPPDLEATTKRLRLEPWFQPPWAAVESHPPYHDVGLYQVGRQDEGGSRFDLRARILGAACGQLDLAWKVFGRLPCFVAHRNRPNSMAEAGIEPARGLPPKGF